MAALSAIMTRPAKITRSRPNRMMTVPVTKLGAYMATTCHWMPSVASVTEWPQPTMATGADVMIRFIIVKLATPQATATMKRGMRAISPSGRPAFAVLGASGRGMRTSASTPAATSATAACAR